MSGASQMCPRRIESSPPMLIIAFIDRPSHRDDAGFYSLYHWDLAALRPLVVQHRSTKHAEIACARNPPLAPS